MLNGILFVIITGVIWTLLAAIYSAVAVRQKSLSGFMFCYALVFAALIWGFCTPVAAPVGEVMIVLLCMLPTALLGQAGFLALFMAMKNGSHALAWTFTQSAMVMPFLASWIFLNNNIKWFNFAGLLLIIAALCGMAVSKRSRDPGENKGKIRALIFSITALLLTGISQFTSLLPGEFGVGGAALSWRLPINTLLGVITWGIAALVLHGKIDRKGIKYSVVYGIVVAAGQITLYCSIDALEPLAMAGIVYPGAVSICIALFAVYCAIFRKEHLSRLTVASLCVLLGAVALLFWK